jgi:hypothetical protein
MDSFKRVVVVVVVAAVAATASVGVNGGDSVEVSVVVSEVEIAGDLEEASGVVNEVRLHC